MNWSQGHPQYLRSGGPADMHREVDKVADESAVMACEITAMATSSLISSSLLPTRSLAIHRQNQQFSLSNDHYRRHTTSKNRPSFRVQAAKPPAGVVLPKVQPKFQAPFLGFTKTAEIWNSRACMIGLVGTFIVELILNKGILQVIGVDVGKGLDLPL